MFIRAFSRAHPMNFRGVPVAATRYHLYKAFLLLKFSCRNSHSFKIWEFMIFTIFSIFVLILKKSILEPSKIDSFSQKSIPKHIEFLSCCMPSSCSGWGSVFADFFQSVSHVKIKINMEEQQIFYFISGQSLNLNFDDVWLVTKKSL